jgi:hypothetical protein
MAQVFTAFRSEAKVNGETIEGLQSIEYRELRNRSDIGAIGTEERVASYIGLRVVSGRVRVASANTTLDGLVASMEPFSITAVLRHGETSRTVAFDECVMDEKSFSLSADAHGETIYQFSATRMREE